MSAEDAHWCAATTAESAESSGEAPICADGLILPITKGPSFKTELQKCFRASSPEKVSTSSKNASDFVSSRLFLSLEKQISLIKVAFFSNLMTFIDVVPI